MGQRIRCQECDDVIESLHGHDFKYCKCGNIFVDGGSDYLRCGWSASPPLTEEGEGIVK